MQRTVATCAVKDLSIGDSKLAFNDKRFMGDGRDVQRQGQPEVTRKDNCLSSMGKYLGGGLRTIAKLHFRSSLLTGDTR